jgi:DeoR family fructose operon transcriptional repressor
MVGTGAETPMRESMYADERRQYILEEAKRHGRVEASVLATKLAVATETIRRDLGVLERNGLIKRTHGGAILLERLGFQLTVTERGDLMIPEKDRIAAAALNELPREGAVLLDGGTTTARLARLISPDRELTVVTRSLQIASILMSNSRLKVFMVGGRVRPQELTTVDDWATRCLADINVDVAYIGTNGVSLERGLTSPDQEESAVKRTMISSARRVVVLADHSKIGVDYFHRFASLDDIDVLITDSGLDRELAAGLTVAVPVVCA